MTSARGERFLDLVAVMDQLRAPGGCPWDARQTHASLVEYLVEETYELVEAIDTSDDAGVREELGDLLLQVVFHARIAQENLDDPWDIDAVCEGIINKLISRHPLLKEAAFFGYADDRLGEKVGLAVVPKAGSPISLADVIGFMKEKHVAVYKLPERLLVLDELPRNAMLKVVRRRLTEMAGARAVEG